MNTLVCHLLLLSLSLTIPAQGTDQFHYNQNYKSEHFATNRDQIGRSTLKERDRQHLYGYFHQATLQEHFAPIHAVSFSPDGNYLASGSEDGAIYIWNAQAPDPDTKLIAILQKHTQKITTLTFSPNSSYLASGSDDKTICIWKTESFSDNTEPLTRFWERDSIDALSFSPDNNLLASAAGDSTVCLWTIGSLGLAPSGLRHTHRELFNQYTEFVCDDKVTSLSFSPNGSYLAVGHSYGTICLWETLSRSAQPYILLAEKDTAISTLCFSPDSTCLAATSNNQTLLWNMNKITSYQAPQITISHNNEQPLLFFSHKAPYFFSRFDGSARIGIWNRNDLYVHDQEPEAIVNLEGNFQANQVCISFDGQHLASCNGTSINLYAPFCSLHPAAMKLLIKCLKEKPLFTELSNDEKKTLEQIPDNARPIWLKNNVTNRHL